MKNQWIKEYLYRISIGARDRSPFRQGAPTTNKSCVCWWWSLLEWGTICLLLLYRCNISYPFNTVFIIYCCSKQITIYNTIKGSLYSWYFAKVFESHTRYHGTSEDMELEEGKKTVEEGGPLARDAVDKDAER
jgi:hypothetical protein